jgi:hypothetical protein
MTDKSVFGDRMLRITNDFTLHIIFRSAYECNRLGF